MEKWEKSLFQMDFFPSRFFFPIQKIQFFPSATLQRKNEIANQSNFSLEKKNIGLCNGLFQALSLVLLLISNLTNGLRLHQFLVTKSAEANKSVKTDANGAH